MTVTKLLGCLKIESKTAVGRRRLDLRRPRLEPGPMRNAGAATATTTSIGGWVPAQGRDDGLMEAFGESNRLRERSRRHFASHNATKRPLLKGQWQFRLLLCIGAAGIDIGAAPLARECLAKITREGTCIN
jgi:hypothetical protein